MNNELQKTIEAVKTAKATNRLHELAKTYGTMDAACSSLDCRAGSMAERIEEAVRTIRLGVKVRIFKLGGKVVVQ
jgi:transcriptional regulator